MRQVTAGDIRRLRWLLNRSDALLLDLTAPATAKTTLARLHAAVVGGLIQCSRLEEHLSGPNDNEAEYYEECA